MNLKQIISEAFKADKTLSKLHSELVKLRSEGIDRETLIMELKEYCDELESETDQDLILDILDCFYGWCNPDARID